MMAALASPHASVAFFEEALKINPHSERARKGLAEAIERLHDHPIDGNYRPAKFPGKVKKSARPRFITIGLFATLTCLVTVWAIWQGVTNAAAFAGKGMVPEQGNTPSRLLYGNTSKSPTALASLEHLATLTASLTPFRPTATVSLPTSTPSPEVTQSATETNDSFPELPSPTPLPTDTDVPVPTPYSLSISQSDRNGDTRWIDVDLTLQMLYAYEGDNLVNSFLVSTGLPETPTVTGQYRIYVKYRYKDLSGPGYYLPDVPFTMFFFEGYALHGTYWHNNFGRPMSRGCVNLSIPDSEWLYNFASVGTLVNIHY